MLSAFCGHLDVVKTIVENVSEKDLLQVIPIFISNLKIGFLFELKFKMCLDIYEGIFVSDLKRVVLYTCVQDYDLCGWTALFYAAAMGHDQVVLLLLEFGSDIHHRDNFGDDFTKRAMT